MSLARSSFNSIAEETNKKDLQKILDKYDENTKKNENNEINEVTYFILDPK